MKASKSFGTRETHEHNVVALAGTREPAVQVQQGSVSPGLDTPDPHDRRPDGRHHHPHPPVPAAVPVRQGGPGRGDRLRLQGRPLRRPEELRRHLHLEVSIDCLLGKSLSTLSCTNSCSGDKLFGVMNNLVFCFFHRN